MTDERLILSGLRDLVEFHQGNMDSADIVRVTTSATDLRAIRKKLQLTQEQLADMYGIPLGTLRNWEQNRRQLDGAAKLVPLLIELIDVIKSDPELSSKIRRKIRERGCINDVIVD